MPRFLSVNTPCRTGLAGTVVTKVKKSSALLEHNGEMKWH